MMDVQVSNARRVGFTALALVAFWVLAWQEYFIASGDVYESTGFSWDRRGATAHYEGTHSLWLAATMALVPSVFFSLGAHNAVFKVQDPLVPGSAILFAAAIMGAGWLGLHDAETWIAAHAAAVGVDFQEPAAVWNRRFQQALRAWRSSHEVSWSSLLLPILTTVFVIFGAWRSAVKARPVLVGGDWR